jgi:hypothetical protein
MSGGWVVHDVPGYDRRFAVVERGNHFSDYLVDRRDLKVYGFAWVGLDYVKRTVAAQVHDGAIFMEPSTDTRDAILEAVEVHDLPRELREVVPIEPRPFRSPWRRLRDWLAS